MQPRRGRLLEVWDCQKESEKFRTVIRRGYEVIEKLLGEVEDVSE